MFKARVETALVLLFAGLATVTAFWPAWIETVFRVDPDGGGGAAEWLVVAVPGVAAIAAFILDLSRTERGACRVPREVWAVGDTSGRAGARPSSSIGTAPSGRASPNLGSTDDLSAVAADSFSNTWLVGRFTPKHRIPGACLSLLLIATTAR